MWDNDSRFVLLRGELPYIVVVSVAVKTRASRLCLSQRHGAVRGLCLVIYQTMSGSWCLGSSRPRFFIDPGSMLHLNLRLCLCKVRRLIFYEVSMKDMYLYLACGLYMYYRKSTGISFGHDVVVELSLGSV